MTSMFCEMGHAPRRHAPYHVIGHRHHQLDFGFVPSDILPGIKRLNAIRNRLAHNLGAHVTEEDAKILMTCERFAALRRARSSGQKQTNEPIEILEDFAKHVAMALNYEFTPASKAIFQAIQEAQYGKAET